LRSFTGHAGPVCGLAFSPDGTKLATAGEDGLARVWNTATGEELLVVSGHATGIGAVAFDPTGNVLATAGGDGFTKLWNIGPAGSYELVAVATEAPATFSAYSTDGAWLATGTEEGDVSIWSAETGERRAVLNGHTGRITGGGFSLDGSLLVTSGEDRTARVWDVATEEQLFVIGEHADTIWSSTFSPDGSMLAIAALDGLVAIWSVPDGQQLARLPGIRAAFSVAFSPGGTLLAVAGLDLQVWDVATWTELVGIDGHSGVILAAEFGPNGRSMATAAGDGSAKLWDISDVRSGSLNELASLLGHSAAVLDVAFNPDGSQLATAALDETVKMWDDTGTELLTLPVRMPGMISFDPTGTRLAVPSVDGAVRIYVLPVGELLDLVSGRLTRSFTAAECLRYLRKEVCPAP
jgi:WD40 repeat protein